MAGKIFTVYTKDGYKGNGQAFTGFSTREKAEYFAHNTIYPDPYTIKGYDNIDNQLTDANYKSKMNKGWKRIPVSKSAKAATKKRKCGWCKKAFKVGETVVRAEDSDTTYDYFHDKQPCKGVKAATDRKVTFDGNWFKPKRKTIKRKRKTAKRKTAKRKRPLKRLRKTVSFIVRI